jgi:hypothetical protein
LKIYKARPDVDRFQYLLLADERDRRDFPSFDGRMVEQWRPPGVFSYQPQLQAGDFWGFNMTAATWATTPDATERLARFLLRAGQVLPVRYGGEDFGLLNVTECVECLDHDATLWRLGATSRQPTMIEKYAFRADRLPESTIFKIPETARGQILCIEGRGDPEDEFKPTAQRLGMTGLSFREIWSDDP